MKLFQTIKEYELEFTLLPAGLKLICYLVFGITLFLGIYSTAATISFNRKIKTLEKMNTQLEKAAVTAQDKAKSAELNAANENLRSQNLEAQLQELQAVKNAQDHEIQANIKKSSDIRNSITHLRVSAPRPISTDDLERRLEDRYSQTKGH